MARIAKQEAAIKQREEENTDRKADKTQQYGEKLRGHRDAALQRIAGYHRHIDDCIQVMKKCETRIYEYKGRVRAQQALIETRRDEAVTLRAEAVRCRATSDSLGTCERELGKNCTDLLEQAELKQREVNRRKKGSR